MLPRLEATEQLAAIRAGALGNVEMDRDDRRRAIEAIEKRAQGGRERRAQKAKRGDIAGMGIGMRVTPKAGKAD